MFRIIIDIYKFAFRRYISAFKFLAEETRGHFDKLEEMAEVEVESVDPVEKELKWYLQFEKMEEIANLQPMSEMLWGKLNGDKVWRKLAKFYHPDIGGNPEIFKELNEAKSRRNIFTLYRYATSQGLDLSELGGYYGPVENS